jgi:hypothetical protein
MCLRGLDLFCPSLSPCSLHTQTEPRGVGRGGWLIFAFLFLAEPAYRFLVASSIAFIRPSCVHFTHLQPFSVKVVGKLVGGASPL